MIDFILILCVIWGVLNIVFFFKIWEMCDNVARLTEKITQNVKENIDNKKEINIAFIGVIILFLFCVLSVFLLFF